MESGHREDPTHAPPSDPRYMLADFRRDFPDDEACLQWLWRRRHSRDGTHAICARCEAERAFKRYQAKQQRRDWTCTACGLHVHPTAGTIFHKSSTGLHLWFYAAYLMTSTSCRISAKQLERELGVTYKTAHRILTMIRDQLAAQRDDELLDGEFALDDRNDDGEPRIWSTLYTHVSTSVPPAPTASSTNDATVDWRLPGPGLEHQRLNDSPNRYVSGEIHTQNDEGL